MRMLDYKRYDVEVHDHWVWFESPLRDKPSSNRLERLYARAVKPMPGLGDADRRVWRYAFIYPNTTIDLYPDQVNTWQMLPDGVAQTRDTFGSYRAPGADPRTRVAQWANQRLNTLVLDEDIDLVANVQQGLQTRGYRCGPLGAREAAVAWFADRDPRRRSATRAAEQRSDDDARRSTGADTRERILAAAVQADRLRRDRRRPDRPDRDGRRRLELARPLPLRHAARSCSPRRSTSHTSAPATRGSRSASSPTPPTPQRLAAIIDQCLPPTPALHEDWVLWIELWLRAVRHPELRPVAEELYARLHEWFADEIAAGVADGEFARCDPDEVADRTLALLDGLGVRHLIGDRTISLEVARSIVTSTRWPMISGIDRTA